MSKEVLLRDGGFIVYTENCGAISVSKNRINYPQLLQYVLSDDFTEEGFERLFVQLSVDDLEAATNGAVKPCEDHTEITVDNEVLVLPTDIQDKVRELMQKGASWTHLENFWRRCLANPNRGSVEQLYRFVSTQLSTIFDDGCFLGYKYVREDYKDDYSGTFDNSPGKVVEMPRDEVTFDPEIYCSTGLHVANLRYAKSNRRGTDRIVCVKVDPADVVSVPFDYDGEKIRVCRYKVLSDWVDETECSYPTVSEDLTPVTQYQDKGELSIDEKEIIAQAVRDKGCTSVNLSQKLGRSMDIVEREMHKADTYWQAINKYSSRYLDDSQLYYLWLLTDTYGNKWKEICRILFDRLGVTVNEDSIRKAMNKLKSLL